MISKTVDIGRHLSARRWIRGWADVLVSMSAPLAFLCVGILLFKRDDPWMLVAIGSVALPCIWIALSARRGTRWAVGVLAVIAVAVPLGLAAYSIVLFAERASKTLGILAAALCVVAGLVWIAWRHARLTHWHLRSRDTSLAFHEYRAGSSAHPDGDRFWVRVARALPGKRARAIVWILVAIPLAIGGFVATSAAAVLAFGSAPEGAVGDKVQEFVGSMLLFLAALFAATQIRHGLRHIALNAAQVRGDDPRAPILFLRSFKDEEMTIQREVSVLWWICAMFPLRLEEFLQQALKQFGPVVAIGRPNEALPPLGAAREYAPDETWQSIVEQRIRESQLVVAILGDSDGLAWELATVDRLAARSKLVLVVPPILKAGLVAARWAKLKAAFGDDGVTGQEMPAKAILLRWDHEGMTVVTAGIFNRNAAGYRIGLASLLHTDENVRLGRSRQ